MRRVTSERASGVKFAKSSMPENFACRARPRLATTTICTVIQQGASGNRATAGQRRCRGGGRNSGGTRKRMDVRVETLNVGSVRGKGKKLMDIIKRKQVDILCIQEMEGK